MICSRTTLQLVRNRQSEFTDGASVAARLDKYIRDDVTMKAIREKFADSAKCTSKLRTMLHGDTWSNNFLFRSKEK